jgi:hypothetical protein
MSTSQSDHKRIQKAIQQEKAPSKKMRLFAKIFDYVFAFVWSAGFSGGVIFGLTFITDGLGINRTILAILNILIYLSLFTFFFRLITRSQAAQQPYTFKAPDSSEEYYMWHNRSSPSCSNYDDYTKQNIYSYEDSGFKHDDDQRRWHGN